VLSLGLSLEPGVGLAAAASPYPSGSSLYLDFTTSTYAASTAAAAAPVARTLAQLVSGATGTAVPSASGMLVDASVDVTVPLSPAVLSGTWFSNSTGSFYVHASIAYVNTSFPRILEMSDGSDANRLILRLNEAVNVCAAMSIASADTELLFTYATTVKIACSFAAGAFIAAVNGSAAQTSVLTLPTMTGLQLGNRNTTKNRQLDGLIKQVIFWPTAKTGAQLTTLTA
jgi:hypothetical protein